MSTKRIIEFCNSCIWSPINFFKIIDANYIYLGGSYYSCKYINGFFADVAVLLRRSTIHRLACGS